MTLGMEDGCGLGLLRGGLVNIGGVKSPKMRTTGLEALIRGTGVVWTKVLLRWVNQCRR